MATKTKQKTAREEQNDALRAKYDKLAADVANYMPGTPEHHKAMEAKKAAFVEWHAADSAREKAEVAATDAEVKQSAAEAAAREATDAKKHAVDVAKHPEKAVAAASAPATR
jgi:hypothetical protein